MSELCPITLRTSAQFIKEHHRHNSPPQGHKFSIGLTVNGKLVGVVIVGRPIARALDDGYTAEVTRCCVLDDIRNANSKLYAAAIRAARAMGYRKIITYTLPEESGASMRAVGFILDGQTAYTHSWNVPSRPRTIPDKYPTGSKNRWIKNLQTGGHAMKEFDVISAAELMKDYAPLPCPTNAPPLTLSQIISIEPRIAEILKPLKPSRSRKRYRQYFEVKSKLGKLIGWQAEQFDLRTSQAYDVIIDVVIEKLNV